MPGDAATEAPSLKKWVLTFVGLVGFVACLSILFLCMRAVMDIGGSCASGNSPYEISRPCPDGVPGLMIGSIFLGIVFLVVYAVNAVGPNLAWLAWPALFISLGWNFLEYGIDPPGPQGGIVWGWLLCAVLFIVMGAGPLWIGISAMRSGKEVTTPFSGADMRARVGARAAKRTQRTPKPRPEQRDEQPESVVGELERLADLRRAGDLTDAQYEDAKERLLREGGKSV